MEEIDSTIHQSKLSDCITDFIHTRLGCILPWTTLDVNKTKNITHCHSYEHVSSDKIQNYQHKVIFSKMMEYVDIMANIMDVGEDVVAMTNCLVPCRR